MKRPPALSDSLLYIGNYDFVSKEQFVTEYRAVNSEPIVIKDIVTNSGFNYCEFICDYTIRFLMHICLISLFETIFFFMFVSVDEDSGVLATTNYYTNRIINNCPNFTQNQIIIIDDILRLFVNTTRVLAAGAADSLQRTQFNMALKTVSWYYVIGLFSLLSGFIGFAKYMKYKIHWVQICGENIVLVCLLGLYEYMFFITIVRKYSTETPGEISALFITGLQNQCKLLKN